MRLQTSGILCIYLKLINGFVCLFVCLVGNTDGRLGGKQYFQCPPKHGKLVRMSDIHAVMNPRVSNLTM